MERHLLETCSETVQNGIIYINQEVESSANHDLSASPAFLALSKVNSDKPIDYIWNDRLGENIDDHIYENIDLLVHFSKLYQEYGEDSWEEHDQLRYARNKLIGVQMAKGDFAITHYPLGGAIWFLAQETKNRKNKPIQEAINQLICKDLYISEYIHSLANIAINILALVEVGEKEYQKTLKMSDQLASKVEDLINSGEYHIYENIHY